MLDLLRPLPDLPTRVADPGAIPLATRQSDDVYEFIVAMSGGRRA